MLGEYGLWLASWGRSTMPPAPAPWQFVAFWQYSSTESVPGIPGEVDADYFNGPEQNIPLYGIPSGSVRNSIQSNGGIIKKHDSNPYHGWESRFVSNTYVVGKEK